MEHTEEVTERYWIKPGICVSHIDMKEIKMRVIRVITTENKEGRKFTKGVLCSWFDGNGGAQTGEFHTTLLSPCDND